MGAKPAMRSGAAPQPSLASPHLLAAEGLEPRLSIGTIRELAAGLKEGDGGAHSITFKPDPSPYSSSFLHEENWLAFDCMQVWKDIRLIYPTVTKDRNRCHRAMRSAMSATGFFPFVGLREGGVNGR